MRRTMATVVVWATGLGVAAAEPALPLEHFTRSDEFGTMKISPDGEFLAITLGGNGRSALAFLDLSDRRITSGVRTDAEQLEIHDFDWVSSTRVIYHIAERRSGSAVLVQTGEIGAIDRNSRAHRWIYGYRVGDRTAGTRVRRRESSYAHPQLISRLAGDDRHILIAEHPWRLVGNWWRPALDRPPLITQLNVYDGRKRSLGAAPLAMAEMLVDRNDEVRFAVGFDERGRLAAQWKPQPRGPWQAFELPGFEPETVLPRVFASDNAAVFLTGVPEGESLQALYRLDLQSQAVEKLHAPRSDDLMDVVLDLTGERVIGVREHGVRPVYVWLEADDPTARLYQALERAFPQHDVIITSTTADGRLAVVFVSSDVNPGDYYLFDTRTLHAEYLQAARSWIDPDDMQPKEPVRLESRDGLALHGYLTRPRNAEPPYPLVVLPHGGPHGIRDTWTFDWEPQLFASRGYAVLQVNFRGSGGYGTDFEAAGYREWGGRMQDDVTDATRWAVAEGLADPGRICIVGGSYGGYAALMGVAREPDLYRCAVGHAGVYDLELMHSSGDIPRSRMGRTYLDDAVGSDPADLRRRSPVHHAERIRVPVLLVHSNEDWRVDHEHARRMRRALQNHGTPVEYLELRGEGHGIFDENTRHDVYQRILGFLGQHMPPIGTGEAAAATGAP
jgi:dipeptidyl aminopeptidase/acylaminoacyl peptidase